MKVIVIGLGSMGKRRIRLIKQYNPAIEIVGADSREDRRQEAHRLYGIETVETVQECTANATAAFICTSPLSHHVIITECLNYGLHVFTELNLVADKYEENIELAKSKKIKLFLSSTLLYRNEINYIGRRVSETEGQVNYIYHVGQYLPDWHPWENYEDFFVGDKRTNGCREFFAIELPWIQTVFGEIENIEVRKSKNSSLNIAYDDNYILLLEHKTKIKGMLAVDVISRKAVRNLEVYGEELYLSWDGSASGLYEYDVDKRSDKKIELYDKIEQLSDYNKSIIENAYLNEIKVFFEYIAGRTCPVYGFEEDKKTIEWLNRIEE